MRLALGLQYDGTDWNGWQTQPDAKTVQDQLEKSIAQFTGSHHGTICAGRTDAGVHANEQVVHLDTEINRPDWSWVRGLNALLPESISVKWAVAVGQDFHARFSALSRTYVYRIHRSPTRSPLHSRYATWFYRPLNISQMREAASHLTGRHDFSAFRSSECQAASPVRELMLLRIDEQGEIVSFTFKANAFLHHMVRNLVGTLVEVGRGVHDPSWTLQVLRSLDRTQAARTFPAQGLCLQQVEYDCSLLCVPESKFAD